MLRFSTLGLRRYGTDSALDVKSLLRSRIKSLGPLSVADFMRAALTSGLGGYYTDKAAPHDDANSAIFGEKGDFVTSPELTQVFGELIGVWFVHQWQQSGHSSKKGCGINLIELGPGKGTLTADILRVFTRFPDIRDRLHVTLVEASPNLCRVQHEALAGTLPPQAPNVLAGNAYLTSQTRAALPISWFRRLEDVPRTEELVPFIVAHEFFDALPIHQFVLTKKGWRERHVGLDGRNELAFTMAPATTLASRAFVEQSEHAQPFIEKARIGDLLEVCPEAQMCAQEIAQRVQQGSGAALIVDYGDAGPKLEPTLRGFKQHRLVEDVFRDVGEMDITADVDFGTLKSVCAASCEVFGPVQQGHWLRQMGIEARLKALLSKCETDDQARVILSACQKLVSPDDMGVRFKFLALGPRGCPAPPGFDA